LQTRFAPGLSCLTNRVMDASGSEQVKSFQS
jgi:hypothetical protein